MRLMTLLSKSATHFGQKANTTGNCGHTLENLAAKKDHDIAVHFGGSCEARFSEIAAIAASAEVTTLVLS